MRSFGLFFSVIALAIAVGSCSASKGEGIPIDAKGRVVVIGNEPFTNVAIEALDGTVYRLEAEASVLQYFRSIQGKTVQIVGRSRAEAQGPVIEVETYVVK